MADSSIITVEVGDEGFLLVHTDDGLSSEEFGTCTAESVAGIIRIRSTLRGSEYTDTVIHEWLHALLPMASEDWVRKSAKQLTDMLYRPEVMKRAGFA